MQGTLVVQLEGELSVLCISCILHCAFIFLSFRVFLLLHFTISSQPSIAELRAEAEALGLEGEEALDFVYKQQEFYRNERASERAARAEESVAREREKEAEHVERDRETERAARAEEREADIEHEVRAADALERERVREQELKELELKKESGQFDQSLNDATIRPKLPQFKDSDDVVSFIIRFECISSLLKIDPNSYAVRICSLLSGKALKIFPADEIVPKLLTTINHLNLPCSVVSIKLPILIVTTLELLE